MARIVQSLTQPLEKYDQQIQQSFVRDVDSVIQKLNTSFQQDLKEDNTGIKEHWKFGTFRLDIQADGRR